MAGVAQLDIPRWRARDRQPLGFSETWAISPRCVRANEDCNPRLHAFPSQLRHAWHQQTSTFSCQVLRSAGASPAAQEFIVWKAVDRSRARHVSGERKRVMTTWRWDIPNTQLRALLHAQEVLGSDLRLEIICCTWGASPHTSVPRGKCWPTQRANIKIGHEHCSRLPGKFIVHNHSDAQMYLAQ
jgi:hypothetical protein